MHIGEKAVIAWHTQPFEVYKVVQTQDYIARFSCWVENGSARLGIEDCNGRSGIKTSLQ